MLKHYAVHNYKGLTSIEQAMIGAGTQEKSWARDRHKSSGRHTSHSNTLSGCKLWAQYSPLAGERYGTVPIHGPAAALPVPSLKPKL